MVTISNNDIARSIYLGSKGKRGNELRLYSQNVFNFLVKKRLVSRASTILLHLQKIINEEEGIVEATLKSAKKLGTESKHHLVQFLRKRYRAKNVVFQEAIDEKLLGGFKVEVGDEVIDLTIKNKIEKLEEHLTRNL